MAYDVSRGTVYTAGASTPRELRVRFADTVNVKDFGAKGDGVTPCDAAFAAAFATGAKVIEIPYGVYVLTQRLLVPASVELRGAGAASILYFTGGGTGLQFGDGVTLPQGGGLRDLVIRGTGTVALLVDHAWDIVVDHIQLQGTWTDGFVFNWVWGSAFSNLSSAPAVVTNACFYVKSAFNANTCSNWYTSNFSTYNILIDSTVGSLGYDSHGNAYTNICVQGGEYGLYIRSGRESSVVGFYSENVVHPIVMGDATVNALALGWSMSGLTLGGPEFSHPHYADRLALIDLQNVKGAFFTGVNFNGSFNVGTVAPVTIMGDGTRAKALSRVTPAGEVHSIEIIDAGTGYTAATVGIGGIGVGATATASVVNGEVVSILVTNGGSGYVPPPSYRVIVPAVVRYNRAYHVTFSGFWFNPNGLPAGTIAPMYPYVVRTFDALSDSGVEILGDSSILSGYVSTADIGKTRDLLHKHYIREHSLSGYVTITGYTPPVFPDAPGVVSSYEVLRRRHTGTTTFGATIAAGAVYTTTVTVLGAVTGNTVSVAASVAVPGGVLLSGQVTAANTVTLTLLNATSGPITLPVGTYTVNSDA